jgi:hypothetical protein
MAARAQGRVGAYVILFLPERVGSYAEGDGDMGEPHAPAPAAAAAAASTGRGVPPAHGVLRERSSTVLSSMMSSMELPTGARRRCARARTHTACMRTCCWGGGTARAGPSPLAPLGARPARSMLSGRSDGTSRVLRDQYGAARQYLDIVSGSARKRMARIKGKVEAEEEEL